MGSTTKLKLTVEFTAVDIGSERFLPLFVTTDVILMIVHKFYVYRQYAQICLCVINPMSWLFCFRHFPSSYSLHGIELGFFCLLFGLPV